MHIDFLAVAKCEMVKSLVPSVTTKLIDSLVGLITGNKEPHILWMTG